MSNTQQIINAVKSIIGSPSKPSPFVMASKRFNYSISNKVNKDPLCTSFLVSRIEQAKSVLKAVMGEGYDEQVIDDNIEGFDFTLDKPLYLVIRKVN